MSAPNDGGPAFPLPDWAAPISSTVLHPGHYGTGMTLRDYFAGQALAVMLQAEGQRGGARTLARSAYIIADGMLEARSHPNVKDMEP